MPNKKPNRCGLLESTRKRKIEYAKKLSERKKAQIEEIRGDVDTFVDHYLISLALEMPDEPKVANALNKWYDTKKKYAEEFNPLMGEE